MKNRFESVWLRPELAFALFALLLGARDVGAELLFKGQAPEMRSCLAFLICLTITVLSLFIVVVQGDAPGLLQKVLNRRILPRVILVGVSAAVVYLVTFEMIGRFGAGKFDLFDYGLAPILTGALGIMLFRNAFTPRLLVAVLAYAAGIFLLFWGNQTPGWMWIAVALLSPIGTAVSDVTTKWLLSEECGNMTRAELLFVRFLPATALIGVWIRATGGNIHLHFAEASIPLAVLGGFLPLWLLCTGLGRAALTKYAVWEFLIPAVAFFATLPLHPEHLTLKATAGAAIIILAVALHEIKWRPRIERSRPPGSMPLSTPALPG
ncbi:MAG TPA: DMT family transporter [Pyrinomonadaceae bacterium]